MIWQQKPFQDERQQLTAQVKNLAADKREILEDFKLKCQERDEAIQSMKDAEKDCTKWRIVAKRLRFDVSRRLQYRQGQK